MVSVVLCLYMGYIGYVAWPAAAPRLAIPEAFSVALRGGSAFLDSTRAATAAIPLTALGAFPSLHCAIALLALLLAWKHLRWYFWVQLPFGVGLIVGTVYLRHHWVVDILAGFVLTFAAFWAGPLLEDAWIRLTERFTRAVRAPTSSSPLLIIVARSRRLRRWTGPVAPVVERHRANRSGPALLQVEKRTLPGARPGTSSRRQEVPVPPVAIEIAVSIFL